MYIWACGPTYMGALTGTPTPGSTLTSNSNEAASAAKSAGWKLRDIQVVRLEDQGLGQSPHSRCKTTLNPKADSTWEHWATQSRTSKTPHPASSSISMDTLTAKRPTRSADIPKLLTSVSDWKHSVAKLGTPAQCAMCQVTVAKSAEIPQQSWTCCRRPMQAWQHI